MKFNKNILSIIIVNSITHLIILFAMWIFYIWKKTRFFFLIFFLNDIGFCSPFKHQSSSYVHCIFNYKISRTCFIKK